MFNVGSYPAEKMEKVVYITLWNKDGKLMAGTL
jgi:hypothetical protein